MSNKTTHVTDEIKLEGFQAILEPGKFGYSLSAVVTEQLIDKLEAERTEVLKWAESKLKNPKRATLKPTPWEEVAEGKYKLKFSWSEDRRPPVVDSEGTVVQNKKTPLYGGSTVKLAFFQKPYIMKDGVTYGSSLKLQGVQIVSLNTEAGISADDLSDKEISDLFGQTEGFKASDVPPETEQDEDF